MAELPDTPNFYAVPDTRLSAGQVAGLFAARGWQVRKCSWTDYEVRTDWAELVVAAAAQVLVHGPVADLPARAEELVAPLRAAGVAFTAECYGPGPDLLLELRSRGRSLQSSPGGITLPTGMRRCRRRGRGWRFVP